MRGGQAVLVLMASRAGTSLLCLVATQLGVRRGLRGSALLDERVAALLVIPLGVAARHLGA